ncbi:MAG: YraN family protein [Muribaculaceae bacterium]|nr:YraN family protein [Muribaculaceae bacterium]
MPYKDKISEIDWSELTPEGFEKKVTTILQHPPGSPGYEDIYKRLFAGQKFKKIYSETWGRYAEAKTIEHLILQGLPIREWNWHPESGKGEIDIIAQRGNRLLFIEVKARSDKKDDPWEAITDKKMRELCRGADLYIKTNELDLEYQFDLALFSGNPEDYSFEYIADAFLCPLTSKR